jgi:methylglyoxal synthase
MAKLSIALIAHDSKKEAMVDLIKAHQKALAGVQLVATRDTGQLVKGRTGLSVTLLQHGPRGGDMQIGALVANGGVRAVIFLRDPLYVQSHEPDTAHLIRICDVHNVPIATNIACAEAVLNTLSEQIDGSDDAFPFDHVSLMPTVR